MQRHPRGMSCDHPDRRAFGGDGKGAGNRPGGRIRHCSAERAKRHTVGHGAGAIRPKLEPRLLARHLDDRVGRAVLEERAEPALTD